jgi:hypothetical protein
MDLLFNTVCNFRYNREKREQLADEYNTIQGEYQKFADLHDEEIENDKENERIYQKMQEAEKKLRIASLRCFAAQFPKTKNKWFADVIDEMYKNPVEKYVDARNYYETNDITISLSRKQVLCFDKYTHDDENYWRSSETYCNAGHYFIIIKHYKSGDGSIRINKIWE